MKITVLNRLEAKEYIPDNTAIIIRMDDTIYFSKLKGDYLASKEFYFSDTENKTNPYAITEQNAKDIISFVRSYQDDIDEIVVHCHYGKGRSPAVAGAIAHHLFNQEFNLAQYQNYNTLVYSMIKNQS